MSTIYVTTYEVDSEGGHVVAVSSTLEAAQRAAEEDRFQPTEPLSWEEFNFADRPTWFARASQGGITSYEVAAWIVDMQPVPARTRLEDKT